MGRKKTSEKRRTTVHGKFMSWNAAERVIQVIAVADERTSGDEIEAYMWTDVSTLSR